MFKLLKFILVDVVFAILRLVLGWIWAGLHAALGFIYRAHAVLFRNLASDRARATGALVNKPVRRS